MAELLIGALAAAGFFSLLRFAEVRSLSVPWWGWALTLAGFFYGVLVLEVVFAFLREGLPQGAAVMGTLLGFGAVLWAALLARFVFRKPTNDGATPAPGRTP